MIERHHLFEIGGRVTLAACLFIGVGALMQDVSDDAQPSLTQNVSAPLLDDEPLEAELRWCRHLGDEALHDKACLHAWAKNRERFLKSAQPDAPSKRSPKDKTHSSTEGR